MGLNVSKYFRFCFFKALNLSTIGFFEILY